MNLPFGEPSPGRRPGGSFPREGLDPGRVDPHVLTTLLARRGWQRRGGEPGRYARWTPPPSDPGAASLLVPESLAFPDSRDLLADALTGLVRSPTATARQVLVALAVPSDELRWSRRVPDRDTGPCGSSPWPAGDRLRRGARAMLLAGALGALGRAAHHGARHRRRAEEALGQVLVGPESAAGTLTAHLPVASGRAAATTLLRALHAARDATDYHRATGRPEAFDAAVRLGVSRELTEAVVDLVHGSEGIRFALEWSPATGAPAGFSAAPEPVEFSPGDLPALRDAGARFVRCEPSVPVRLTGVVVRMRRRSAAGPGTVALRVLTGADVGRVRAELDENSYRTAVHAHLVGLPIRVSGRLESSGGFRRLTGARDVEPVRVDETERDRMMKSLHENLGCFEEAWGGEDDG
ncbi:hypothetical protein [Streptomyces meridianus]|uniref:Uncharacterized protein n=1 Tax=Streptomyces meridianus TaxID=2938945 RepID=A0ABT0XA72_9ACTN|nr:hypothetical protein [Streptomyces meridianus]MCM2579428.1 hypothetical protein [Streptomyces meridianus]